LRETLFFGKRKGFLALFLKEIEMGIGCSIGMSGGSKGEPALPAFGKRKGLPALFLKEIEMGIGCSIGMYGGSKCQPALLAFGKRKGLLALFLKEICDRVVVLSECPAAANVSRHCRPLEKEKGFSRSS